MQPLNRILFLIILASLAFYWWMRQQTKDEYYRQVGALATTLDRRLLSPSTPARQAESMFLRALVIFADYRSLVARGRLQTAEDTYLRESLSAAGYSNEGEITLVIRALRDNLALCQQTRVISEADGAQALLSGQAPVIGAGPFKGDTLVIGRRVPASLAPTLANHPANYALLPSAAAALIWPYTLTDSVMYASEEFRGRGLLDAATAAEIQKRADLLKPTKAEKEAEKAAAKAAGN